MRTVCDLISYRPNNLCIVIKFQRRCSNAYRVHRVVRRERSQLKSPFFCPYRVDIVRPGSRGTRLHRRSLRAENEITLHNVNFIDHCFHRYYYLKRRIIQTRYSYSFHAYFFLQDYLSLYQHVDLLTAETLVELTENDVSLEVLFNIPFWASILVVSRTGEYERKDRAYSQCGDFHDLSLVAVRWRNKYSAKAPEAATGDSPWSVVMC